MAETSVGHSPEVARQRTPLGVRVAVLAFVGLLTAGAVALIALRGDIMLIDLATLGSRIWCF